MPPFLSFDLSTVSTPRMGYPEYGEHYIARSMQRMKSGTEALLLLCYGLSALTLCHASKTYTFSLMANADCKPGNLLRVGKVRDPPEWIQDSQYSGGQGWQGTEN